MALTIFVLERACVKLDQTRCRFWVLGYGSPSFPGRPHFSAEFSSAHVSSSIKHDVVCGSWATEAQVSQGAPTFRQTNSQGEENTNPVLQDFDAFLSFGHESTWKSPGEGRGNRKMQNPENRELQIFALFQKQRKIRWGKFGHAKIPRTGKLELKEKAGKRGRGNQQMQNPEEVQ